MRIGTLQLDNPLVMAPMAGVTDIPFRSLVKAHGAGLVYSEMISAQGLLYANPHTQRILEMTPTERPVAVQLFGSQPAILAQAARIVEDLGADLVDINMGCPVPKIVRSGEGCALMKDVDLGARIVAAVVNAVNIPVTVKMRKGWDDTCVNGLHLALAVEKAGAAAVAVHGRTRDQFYGGQADWDYIRQIKSALTIPVIGNGDVWKPEDALAMIAATGCDGVMIGRGALGNPWLFSRTLALWSSGKELPEPSVAARIITAVDHLDRLVAYKGNAIGVKEMRKHASWYIKGLRHAAEVRVRINQADTRDAMASLLVAYGETLMGVPRETWVV
jgi:tRNA-dihydrouridine synthase B